MGELRDEVPVVVATDAIEEGLDLLGSMLSEDQEGANLSWCLFPHLPNAMLNGRRQGSLERELCVYDFQLSIFDFEISTSNVRHDLLPRR